MKKYIGIVLLLAISCTGFAQIQRTVVKQKTDSTTTTEKAPEKKNESRKEMFRELNLSKEQKVKMKEINQSMKVSREAIENETSLSDIEKKGKLRKLKKEQAEKIQAILTAEQIIKFKELRTKKKDEG